MGAAWKNLILLARAIPVPVALAKSIPLPALPKAMALSMTLGIPIAMALALPVTMWLLSALVRAAVLKPETARKATIVRSRGAGRARGGQQWPRCGQERRR